MQRKRSLSPTLILYQNRYFPSVGSCTGKGGVAVVGVGGNIGDTKRRFSKLFWYLKRQAHLKVCKSSSILQNPPFGYTNQEDFFNVIMIVKTVMTPCKLLDFLLKTEKKFGRKRSFQDAPRTLDLDLIFYDNRAIKKKRLTLPHPKWHERESVIIPLQEVIA